MSAAAVWRTTRALASALQRALRDAGEPGTVFVGPLDDPGAQGAPLILLLYRIVPNASLRNGEHRAAAGTPGGAPVVYRNALPLDLYYLITVGAEPGPDDRLLRVLGIAIQALNEFPHLVGIGQEAQHVSMEPLSTEEISRIWSLFPTVNYRTSLAYFVSPVWVDPRTQPLAAPPVLADTARAGLHREEQDA